MKKTTFLKLLPIKLFLTIKKYILKIFTYKFIFNDINLKNILHG